MAQALISILLTLMVVVLPAAASETVTVVVDGVGFIAGGDTAAARDRAIRDAQLRALEQALGVEVDARTAIHKALLIDDTMVSHTRGSLRRTTILEESIDPMGLYRVRAEVAVAPSQLSSDLEQAAGEKRLLILLIDEKEGATMDQGAVQRIAAPFADAGFSLSAMHLAGLDAIMVDAGRIVQTARKTGSDLVLSIWQQTLEPDCRAANFCGCLSSGRIRLYQGSSGKLMAQYESMQTRGYGYKPDAAQADARTRNADMLTRGLMDLIQQPPERTLEVIASNVPDQRAYRHLKQNLGLLRWVRAVEPDSVGYHPVKSVFYVRFAQDEDVLANMLEHFGTYRFEGRTGHRYYLNHP